MKLASFRILNCFGFSDSGEINFLNPNNFVYLLGRNSSGKSSLLNAIDYFEVNRIPSEKRNFLNFNDTGSTASLIATFDLAGEQLKFALFGKKLTELLNNLHIDASAIQHNEKIGNLIKNVHAEYKGLFDDLNSRPSIRVGKLGDGSYLILSNDREIYKTRQKNIEGFINAAREPDRTIIINGNPRQIDLSFRAIEDLFIYQLPSIYIFNEKHPLNEALPDNIDAEWENESNAITKKFIAFLGAEKIDRFFQANDPDERDHILAELRKKVRFLVKKVNSNPSTQAKTDLLSMRLDPNTDGIQITVGTDKKKSFYGHMSDNTKYLFADHLFAQTESVSGSILLFDEPNNGFHPTAQKRMLGFLQDLANSGNQVIVSTHSEYLIDPDYLSSVRIMTSDKNNYIVVKNHFYNQTSDEGHYFALQPIFDAIGFKYGGQLEVTNKVVITEGVTDLLYLRAFKKILQFSLPLNIAPARGEGTIPHVVSFLISQGLSFKIVLDTGNIKPHLQSNFGIEDKFIHEIPIPTAFRGRMTGSGIEDLFGKTDFKWLLGLIGHTTTPTFSHVSNSHYMKTDVNPGDKRLVAHSFYETADTYTKKSFEKETLDNFRQAFEFCKNSDWFSL